MASRIQFLGTGGGRINLVTQLRSTAGIYAELKGERIYLDPGPGALIRSRTQKIRLENLDAVLVSHNHIDHTNDAAVLIEAMTAGTRKKRGLIAAPSSVLEGEEKAINYYHQDCAQNKRILKAGDEFNIGALKITVTPTEHTDKAGIGFIFHAEKTISYLSDTLYTKAIAKKHIGSDIIILNCVYLKWDNEKADGYEKKHMDVEDTKRFIKDINPKLAIIQHIGMGIIKHGPWKIAQQIEEDTGIKTVSANDNQIFDIEADASLGTWLKK
ncbi:MAG: MBL fold metallo-hydrolase [archaeon]